MTERVIDVVHQKIHDRRSFYVNDWSQLASPGTRELLIETPADNEIHMDILVLVPGGTLFQSFRGTTKVRAPSNVLDNINRFDYADSPTSEVVISHTPTGSGDGFQLRKMTLGLAGAGFFSSPGTRESRRELILRHSTKYLWRFAGEDGDYTLSPDWYEVYEE